MSLKSSFISVIQLKFWNSCIKSIKCSQTEIFGSINCDDFGSHLIKKKTIQYLNKLEYFIRPIKKKFFCEFLAFWKFTQIHESILLDNTHNSPVLSVGCASFSSTLFPSTQLSVNMLGYSTLWTASFFGN